VGAATPGHPAAVAATVVSGPARSLGEPAAAQDSAVTAVVATSFGSAGAQVRAWTKPARAASWSAASFDVQLVQGRLQGLGVALTGVGGS